MLKNIRVTPDIAANTSTGFVRSPTMTSAPWARSASARASSRCTMARTVPPWRSSRATTCGLIPAMPPPAPVMRYVGDAVTVRLNSLGCGGSDAHLDVLHQRLIALAAVIACRDQHVHLRHV